MLGYPNVHFVNLHNAAFSANTTKAQSMSMPKSTEPLELNIQNSGSSVLFKDASSNRFIKLNLSDENLKNLKMRFKSNDFSEKNGSTLISGEAGQLVGSWFAHFAYDLNYLEADKNKDKKITAYELTKAYVNVPLNPDITANQIVFKSGTQNGFMIMGAGELSLEDSLNSVLEQDENLDRAVSYREIYSDNDLRSFAEIAQTKAKEQEKKKDKNEEESELEKARKYGISGLKPEELERLKAKHPQEFEKLELKQNLQDSLKNDFARAYLNGEIRVVDFLA